MDIIMMGDSKAGRTSIAKVIFQRMGSKQTMMLGQTTKMQTYDFKIQKIAFKLYDFPAKYDISDPPPNEQMILKNASALVFVLNPQSDTSKALQQFLLVYEYLKKKNKSSCSIFLFTNKADIDLTQQDSRSQYQIKLKKKLNDQSIDLKELQMYFTSIFDYSIFEAFSKVIKKMIPCAQNICKILNQFAENCKVQKVYLFDLITKLYIAHNDHKIIEQYKYEICSDMLDVFIDISFLYGNQKQQPQDNESKANIKLCIQNQSQIIMLRFMEKYLALVYNVKQSNFDRPYLVEQNVNIFKESLNQLLNITINALK